MKKFTTIQDLDNTSEIIQEAIALKKTPFQFEGLGKHKTLVMLFFNSSLRTRLRSILKKLRKSFLNMQIL